MTSANLPQGVCANCFATWRARKPRPLAVYCWHGRTVARPTRNGDWRTETATDGLLREMRAEGLL